jgi:hypothetical protein
MHQNEPDSRVTASQARGDHPTVDAADPITIASHIEAFESIDELEAPFRTLTGLENDQPGF